MIAGRALAAILALAWWGTAALAFAQTPEPERDVKPNISMVAVPVVVLDTRTDASTSPALHRTRAAVLADIARSPDIAAHADGDAELLAALSGQLQPALLAERDAAAQTVTEAATAFGQLDCRAAESAAERAIVALAGLRAVTPGDDAISGHLRRAYAYRLLCAHNRSDSDGAMRVRAMFERLASTGQPAVKPDGVSDLVWNLYPPLDATANTPIHEVEVKSEPAGATMWVDFASAGKAPGKVLLPQGRHLFAAASGKRHHAALVDVTRDGQVVSLTLPEAPKESQHLPISTRVGEWQRGVGEPTGAEIGALLRQVGVQFALVLVSGPTKGGAGNQAGNQAGTQAGTQAGNLDMIAVWALPPDETEAQPLLAKQATRVADIGQAVRIHSLGRRRTGPEPGVPLLREPKNGRTGRRDTSKKPKWWVYATIIGAVTVGATLFLANDLADNRQRIELTW